MKIIGLFILKQNDENPLFMATATDLSFVYWYQRPFAKEHLKFGARTCTSRVKLGTQEVVDLKEAQATCYIQVDKNGIAYLCITDAEYPQKVAFLIINEMSREFQKEYNQIYIDSIDKDQEVGFKKLDQFIKEYQDPKEADKMLKLETTLNEVTNIVHKNMDDLMRRGENLDQLMAKSKDVSSVSYDFYKKAKKNNQQCCVIF